MSFGDNRLFQGCRVIPQLGSNFETHTPLRRIRNPVFMIIFFIRESDLNQILKVTSGPGKIH